MTLTEQWKKGELESSKQYYVEYVDGRTGKANLIETPDFYGFYNNCSLQDEVKEVLAPVPSYEKWQRLQKYAHKCEVEYIECANDYEKLKEENQQLKDLLKECQYMILAYSINHDTFTKEKVLDTIKQIDNAMGEKK